MLPTNLRASNIIWVVNLFMSILYMCQNKQFLVMKIHVFAMINAVNLSNLILGRFVCKIPSSHATLMRCPFATRSRQKWRWTEATAAACRLIWTVFLPKQHSRHLTLFSVFFGFQTLCCSWKKHFYISSWFVWTSDMRGVWNVRCFATPLGRYGRNSVQVLVFFFFGFCWNVLESTE